MINPSSLFMTVLAATIASAKVCFSFVQLPPTTTTYLEIIGGDQWPQNTIEHLYIGRWSCRLPSCAWAWSVPILWVQVASGSRQKRFKEWKIFGSWWWSSTSLAISWWSRHPRWAMNPATGSPRLPCWPNALTPSFVTQPARWTFHSHSCKCGLSAKRQTNYERLLRKKKRNKYETLLDSRPLRVISLATGATPTSTSRLASFSF